MLYALPEELAVDRVTISKQESRRFVIRKRFDDLLGRPARTWVGTDVEVGDPAAIEAEQNEARRNAKCRCRYREEIDCDDVPNMVVQKSLPRL